MSNDGQEVSSVKILTWNVNGIRSLYKDGCGMKEGLDSLDADIICLQETKVSRNALTQDLAIVDGYNSYYGFPRSKSGYSGVATYCKNAFTPFRAEEGLSGLFASSDAKDSVGFYGNIRAEFSKIELKELDFEGRAVITQHKIMITDADEKVLTIINVYCPRAEIDNEERLQVKLGFYHLLEVRTRAILDSGSLVIIVGDLNICHKPIDHCDPTDMEDFNKNPCRKWLNRIIYDPRAEENTSNVGNVETFRLIDAFRFVNPVEENAFTCWSTKLNARARNYGTRIDYILIDMKLGGEMDDCIILKDVFGSDHCPVKAIIDIKFVRATKCPSFCTKYYPEFVGTQRKLSDFFQRKTSDVDLGASTTADEDTNKRKKLGSQMMLKSKSDVKRQKGIASFFQIKPSTTQSTCSSMFVDLEDQCSGNRSGMESASSLSSLSEISPDSSESVSFDSILGAQSSGSKMEDNSSVTLNESECAAEPESKMAAEVWKSILTGPKPAPKCKGHNEPCVQKVVKKKGPNFNRKFWVCVRGEGPSNDPSSKCNHFQWDSKR